MKQQMRLAMFVVALVTAAASGCSDDTEGDGGQGGAGADSTAHGGGGAATASSGAAEGGGGDGQGGDGQGGGTGTPHPPNIESVEPLDGGLHIMWENVTPDCDSIELDRNKDGGAYATAYTLTGTAFEQHDAAATAPGEYCYKARCLEGAQTSADSNEMCGTP